MRKTWALLLFTIILFGTCSPKLDPEPLTYPELEAPKVSNISNQGVILSATMKTNGVTEFSDHGFLWSTEPNVILSSSEIQSLGNISNINSFDTRINTRLSDNQQYYVRSFVDVGELRVLSDTTSFFSQGSLGPELSDFFPKEGHIGQSITLVGTGFSNQFENNKVFFNSTEALIGRIKQDTLEVVVPKSLSDQQSQIRVTVAGESSIYASTFSLYQPMISGFNSSDFSFGEEIEIITTGVLPEDKSKIELELAFDDNSTKALEQDQMKLSPFSFVVPEDVSSNTFNVILRYNNLETKSDASLSLRPAVIDELNTTEIEYLDELIITGEGFSPIVENNKVFLENVEAEILEAGQNDPRYDNQDFIKVQVPSPFFQAYSQRTLRINVQVLGTDSFTGQNVEIVNKWFRVSDTPFYNSFFLEVSKGLTLNNRGYILANQSIYEFNPENMTWTFVTSFPGSARSDPVFFGLDGKLFTGLGKVTNDTDNLPPDLWEYSIESGQWTQLPDFPGRARYYATSFASNGVGYIGLGISRNSDGSSESLLDFWAFDPETKVWSVLKSFPNRTVSRARYGHNANGIFVGFTFPELTVQKYNPVLNDWESYGSFPFTSRLDFANMASNPVSESIFLFIFNQTDTESRNRTYKFDTDTKVWSQLENLPSVRQQLKHLFTLHNKMYSVLIGPDLRIQLWEFDPSFD